METKIKRNHKKHKKTIRNAILIVALSLLFFVVGVMDDEPFLRLFGAASAIFFAGYNLLIIHQSRRFQTLIVLSPQGLTDCSMPRSPGLIPWEYIVDVGISKSGKTDFLDIYIRNIEQFKAGLSKSQLRNVNVNMNLAYPPVRISLLEAEGSPLELQQKIWSYMRTYGTAPESGYYPEQQET